MPGSHRQYLLGVFFVLASALTYASKAIFVKLAYRHMNDPGVLLTLRMFFTMSIFAVVWVCIRPRPVKDLDVILGLKIVALGVLGFYVSALLDFHGLQYLTASLERIIIFIYPTIVVLLALFFEKKKITTNQLVALSLTYLGLLIAFYAELTFDQKNVVLGGALVLGCAVTYAGYVYGSGRLIPHVGVFVYTVFALGAGSVATLLHQAWIDPVAPFVQSKEVYLISFFMALVATVLPTIFLGEGIKRIGSSRAAIVATASPIFTIFLAGIFLGEITSWLQLAGALMVLTGVGLLSRRPVEVEP